MPRKRRKLSKEMEAEMAAAKRKIELIMALIHDIRDDDIQGEYLEAFGQIRSAVVNLVAKYTTDGFCEETEGLLAPRVERHRVHDGRLLHLGAPGDGPRPFFVFGEYFFAFWFCFSTCPISPTKACAKGVFVVRSGAKVAVGQLPTQVWQNRTRQWRTPTYLHS